MAEIVTSLLPHEVRHSQRVDSFAIGSVQKQAAEFCRQRCQMVWRRPPLHRQRCQMVWRRPPLHRRRCQRSRSRCRESWGIPEHDPV